MGASILGFGATLLATLIGVWIAFALDRRSKRRTDRQTAVQHLRSIKNELEGNSEAIWQNHQVVNHLQKKGNEASHYTLEPYSSLSWEAALRDQLIEHVDEETYQNLQDIYNEIENVNELIHRLRTESIHPDMGQENGVFGQTWTITVAHWDESAEEVKEIGLGDLIRNRGNDLNIQISGITEELEEAIDELERE